MAKFVKMEFEFVCFAIRSYYTSYHTLKIKFETKYIEKASKASTTTTYSSYIQEVERERDKP